MVSSIQSQFSSAHQMATSRSLSDQASSRLSSGSRINSAKDDAAGLMISDRMSSQVRGLNQAAQNAGDGISLVQTADGALNETASVLQRMRELAIQASNGTYNDQDRQSMNSEFAQLQSELDRIAEETTFNGEQILDGSVETDGKTFQVGANADQTIEVTVNGATLSGLGVDGVDILSVESAGDALGAIDEALTAVDSIRGELGATMNRFESTIENLNNVSENMSASNSRIADADVAAEVSDMLKNRILEQAGVSIQTQANQQAGSLLALIR